MVWRGVHDIRRSKVLLVRIAEGAIATAGTLDFNAYACVSVWLCLCVCLCVCESVLVCFCVSSVSGKCQLKFDMLYFCLRADVWVSSIVLFVSWCVFLSALFLSFYTFYNFCKRNFNCILFLSPPCEHGFILL